MHYVLLNKYLIIISLYNQIILFRYMLMFIIYYLFIYYKNKTKQNKIKQKIINK